MKSVVSKMSDGKIKSKIRKHYREAKVHKRVGKLDIVNSGFEAVSGERYPYIELADGHKFYGYTSEEYNEHYKFLSDEMKDVLIQDAYFVAEDYYRSYVATSGFEQDKYYTPKRGDTVVQIGPYLGHFTTQLSHQVGEDGRVIAIEAHPENYRLLEANVRENCLDNVTTMNKAVSNTNGELTFYETTGPGGKSYSLKLKNFDEFDVFTDDMISKISVDGITLDEVVENIDICGIDYLILTVNGEEANILRGASQTLQQNLDIALVASSELTAIEDMLSEAGFEYTVEREFAPIIYASKTN